MDLIGKYFKVTNSIDYKVTYIYCKDISKIYRGYLIIGDKYDIINTGRIISITKTDNGYAEYYTIPDPFSDKFEEITEEEYKHNIKKVIKKI